MEFTISQTNKGKKCLMHDGYRYKVDSTLVDGYISWRCTNKVKVDSEQTTQWLPLFRLIWSITMKKKEKNLKDNNYVHRWNGRRLTSVDKPASTRKVDRDRTECTVTHYNKFISWGNKSTQLHEGLGKLIHSKNKHVTEFLWKRSEKNLMTNIGL